jgi:hypothetical protein
VWSNCLIEARRRFHRDGGAIVLVRSHYGWWNHRYWTGDGEYYWAFETTNTRLLALYRSGWRWPWSSIRHRWPIPPLIFPGHHVLYRKDELFP